MVMGGGHTVPMFSARMTSGLIAFSIVLMASVLVISIVTLVQVYQIETKTGQNESTSPQNGMNIPTPPAISPDSEKYKAYANYANRLQNSLDLSRDPCNNFYEYACGNFNGSISFTEIMVNNLVTVIRQFNKADYMGQPKLPNPVKQAGKLFEKCVKAKSDWDKEVGKGERLTGKMDKLESLLGIHFPILKPEQEVRDYPDAPSFSSALAHLNQEENLPTFLTMSIETNWERPHDIEQPYMLAFDQATLSFSEAYYTRIWDQIEGQMLEYMVGMMRAYAAFRGAKVDGTKIEEDAKAMLEMEYEIGAKLNAKEATRRNYKGQYNVYIATDADAISKHLTFEQTIKQMVPSGMDGRRVANFMVKEPTAIKNTMEYLFDSKKVQPRTIYNYLFYRLLAANIDYLPKKPKLKSLPQANTFRLGLPRGQPRRPSPFPGGLGHSTPSFDLEKMFSGEELVLGQCAMENAVLFPWANGRAFLDGKYPKEENRVKLRANIRTMIAGVVDAFKGMLDQLNWMTAKAKEAAYVKIDKLITNAAWPEVVENDDALTKYYDELALKPEMSYTEMVDALEKYQQKVVITQLFTAKDIDRYDFSSSPSIVNAWYQPQLNSITFPLGILEAPFYDPNYPAAVNYAGIGLVAGHELTHGFDDQGIQWDGIGMLQTWMDQKSEDGFKNMAQCVVDEYGHFEPIPGLPIDGVMTQGENIADNGGLRASFRAYRTHVGLYGPDARLPDNQLKMLTHDQLFFLSFGQAWCQKDGERDLKKQLLIDPHSPSKYRILGSIQNFPAFRAAFNCPLDSTYGPAKHCQVWESESKTN